MANPYRVRTFTCWVAKKVSACLLHGDMLPPLPGFAWRNETMIKAQQFNDNPRPSLDRRQPDMPNLNDCVRQAAAHDFLFLNRSAPRLRMQRFVRQ